MCTVTFIPRQRGYALGMNRDEKLSRVKGLPPKQRTMKGVKVLCPSEPSGGTWIALNEAGVTFALINWYSVPALGSHGATSRGGVVLACSHAATSVEAHTELAALPLRRINPFRLIGIFACERKAAEWRWDLRKLERVEHPWRVQQWISSGYDEPAAQRIRGQTFLRAKPQRSFGSMDWLRRLHRSHKPHRGPFSTCMHRSDAATVSYSEVSVSRNAGILQVSDHAPCCATLLHRGAFLLKRPASLLARDQGS